MFYEDEILLILKKEHPNDEVIKSLTKKEIRKAIKRYWTNVASKLRLGFAVRIKNYLTICPGKKINLNIFDK
jgi:hypothetical protein